jgi:hypothetical protein
MYEFIPWDGVRRVVLQHFEGAGVVLDSIQFQSLLINTNKYEGTIHTYIQHYCTYPKPEQPNPPLAASPSDC